MSNPPTRNEIITALNVQASQGATRDELILLSGYEVTTGTRKGFGSSLSALVFHKTIVEFAGKFYLREFNPAKKPTSNPQPYQNGHAPQVAPVVTKRAGKTVSIYRSPLVLTDVVSILMLIGDHWYEVPFWDSLRICIGMERPNWTPEDRSYTGCTLLKITYKNGNTDEEHTAPKEFVTISPEG